MLVKSLQYPNIEVILASGLKAYFKPKNPLDTVGFCDMQDSDALVLAQNPSLYEIIREATILGEKIPFNPKSWKKERKLAWDGHIGYHNGYGKASMAFIEALSSMIDIYPLASQYANSTTVHSSDKLNGLLKKPLDKLDTYYIRMQAGQNLTNMQAQRSIGFTMFETTKIPKSWVENLNKLERVLVPCQQNKEAFEECGVNVDVKVIPLGVTEDYKYIERVEDDNFVFSTMGTLTYRKGTDLLVKAFSKVFPKDQYPNVQLYIKSLGNNGVGHAWFIDPMLLKSDSRISMYFNALSPSELIDYFKNIDCFVFPTRGEGFGLPPLEAMATGLPVICTKWSGCADFINSNVAYPLDYKMIDCPPDPNDSRGFGPILHTEGMQWAEPDFDQLCEQMKFIYENRDKAKVKGKKAAVYVKNNWTYKHAAQKLTSYLDEKF